MPLLLAILVWMVFYHSTLYSMAYIWWHFETFTHGFLIFPISIYLIWDKRELFYSVKKKSSMFFLCLLFFLVLLWIMADIVDVNLVKQFVVVAMVPIIVGSLYGFNVVKAYLFPFFYLLFAIPFGEFLVPELQKITAEITVLGLQWTGIPVYTEALYISIPKGDFEVAVACSGIRYLIASLALGTLYAYLMYHKFYKRFIFILASIIIPIIANGLRAYGIVMIAHLSDMKYATGTDHLIYGWLFFGFVIFILFWLGSFWQDGDNIQISADKTKKYEITSSFPKKFLLIICLILSLGPLSLFWTDYSVELSPEMRLIQPDLTPQWKQTQIKLIWQPGFIGADRELKTAYKDSTGHIINLYIAMYLSEGHNKELINFNNYPFDIKKWRLLEHNKDRLQGKNDISYNEYILNRSNQTTIIWGWYYVFGQAEQHPVKVKVLQAMGKITGLAREGSYISIAMEYDGDKEQARQLMKEFVSENSHKIYQVLDELKEKVNE